MIVYGKTEREVKEKLLRLQRAPLSSSQPTNISLGEWLDHWLEDAKSELKHNTYVYYADAVRKHLKPYAGHFKLADLKVADIKQLLSDLRRDGVGGRARQRAYQALYRALNVAFKDERIPRNVCVLVERPRHQAKAKAVLTNEQIRVFREPVARSSHHALFILALDSGMRQGELLALRWEDVNFSNRTVQVRASLTRGEAGKLVIQSPKTMASVRIIRLPKATCDVLWEHRKRALRTNLGSSPWVFATSVGTPINKDNLNHRHFRPLLRRAGLPPIPFHALRHTHATQLAINGVSPKAIQTRLGHASSRMTLDVYTHAQPEMEEQAIAALDKMIANCGQNCGQSRRKRSDSRA
ncbi:MAG: site-specific integrase [Candidatus Eremiobacteraeota bacterium]|nr:site-specific integrase [Candidatus Eremiobacteraeota bacterium]MBC5828557.1 site-specific integrase [Candidatus Eremiobacteraeota bacterium]